MIPQESEIFEATLRDNLTFGAAYSEEQIERAARLSALDAVAASLPQKWDMPLSERGINLSGGQRQRLALARGLLAGKRSSVLLLDEPTSALDQATEATVFERLREGLPDTCIIASIHRLSALIYFNRVIVMAEGRIADSGTLAEILERQPAFREIVYSAAHRIRSGLRVACHRDACDAARAWRNNRGHATETTQRRPATRATQPRLRNRG